MRVTMLSWEYPPVVVGGLGRHVDALSRALAHAGTDVEVVTRGAGDAVAQETRDKVEVVRTRGDEVEIGFAVESLLAWASSADHALLRAALPRVLAQRPDVVHAHDWLVAQSAVTLAQTADVPLVTTIHATEWGRNRGQLTTPLRRAIDSVERWLVHQSDRVVVCSQAMRGEVVDRLGADPAHVDVVPGGVEAATWDGPRPSRTGPPVLLFAGRVEWEKGLQTVVEALPAIRRAFPGTTLRVAGGGGYLEEVRALTRRRRVASAVTWLGRLDDAGLAAAYRDADVVVIPSLYEPFGLVALEAAAAGTPRVVARTGGLAEQVHDGVTGVVVPPGAVDDVAVAIGGLLADPRSAARLAAAARREVRARHDWAGVAAATGEVYGRAVR